MTTRLRCSRCKMEKPVTEFQRRRSRPRGYQYVCKACKAKYYQEHKNEIREIKRTFARKYYHGDKEAARLADRAAARTTHDRYIRSRRTAIKQRKISWAMTEEEFGIAIAKDCFYCGGFFGKSETGCGLDRLDSAAGYSADNVVSCCRHCNLLKLDSHTPEETLAMVKVLIEMRRPKLYAVPKA